MTGQPNETHCNPDNVHLKTTDCSKLLHLKRTQRKRKAALHAQAGLVVSFFLFFFLFLVVSKYNEVVGFVVLQKQTDQNTSTEVGYVKKVTLKKYSEFESQKCKQSKQFYTPQGYCSGFD